MPAYAIFLVWGGGEWVSTFLGKGQFDHTHLKLTTSKEV